MTRAIDALTLAQLESDTARPIFFVELRIDETSSPQVIDRLHTGVGTITWGGFNWTGAGALATIEDIDEGSELNPNAIKMGLSGVDSDVTDLVFNTDYYRAPVIIYLGAFGDDGALVADPSTIFSGFIESIDMVVGGEDGDSVVLTAESELILFQRSKKLRYSDAALQAEYSGDLGLEFLDQVKNAKVVWRGSSQAAMGTGAGSTPPSPSRPGGVVGGSGGGLRPGGF